MNNILKVQNKVIVVTGGGNGMGREIVLHLLSKGVKVVAADISEKGLQGTITLARSNENLMVMVTDITNRSSVESLLNVSIEKFGGVDGIINNAGIIQPFKTINNIDFDTIERVINVNLYGMINMTKAFLPTLLGQIEAYIVNISSMGGFLPVPGQAIYGASKAGVKILSESLSAELSQTQVKVTTVIPGAIFTSIKANSGLGTEDGAGTEGHKENAAFSPAKAAILIVNAIEKEKPKLYIGKDSKSMNFMYRISPAFATKLITKKINENHKL